MHTTLSIIQSATLTKLSLPPNHPFQVHVSHTSPLVGQRVGSATDLKTVHDLRVLGYQRSHGHPDTKLNEFLIKVQSVISWLHSQPVFSSSAVRSVAGAHLHDLLR